MSVVVVGDANVDLEVTIPSPQGNDLQDNPEPQLFGGGSAANTAAALARLGVVCRFTGTVGDDLYGRFAVADLAAAGVDTQAMTMTASDPTVMVIAVIRPDGERLIYVWPPTGGAHRAVSPDAAVAAVNGSTWLHVSGICLRVLPAAKALLAAMERARATGVPVSFDLNLRLENWGWDDGFRDTVMAAVEHADVVVGGGADEIGMLAGQSDPVQAARSLTHDERLVIARLGPGGAIACSTKGEVVVPGFVVEVMDTVGAGDAFNAGFIAARLRGLSVPEALRWGNAVAAFTITQPGARSTPTIDELEAFLRTAPSSRQTDM
jgi:sugar/nucleoside kinase (ribokinase family)